MSIYTVINKDVVDALNASGFPGTYILRMEPVYAERPHGDTSYDDYCYVVAEEQVRYWAWGHCMSVSYLFEVMETGDLFTANRKYAIHIMEMCQMHFGEQFVFDNFHCDNDCLWCYNRQKWIPRSEYLVIG